MTRPKRQKNWIKKNRGRKETERSRKIRLDEISDNQLGSKILWEELFLDDVTDGSQLFLLRNDIRDENSGVLIPRRVSVNELREWFFPACFDEGDAESVYEAENIYDEGDATEQILDLEWDEGDATFIPIICTGAATVPITDNSTLPIVNITSNTTFDAKRYYRVTGGTTFTITAASGTFNANNPFEMIIKNASGVTITINRSGSDTFYAIGGAVTTFDLLDGEVATLISSANTEYDVEVN